MSKIVRLVSDCDVVMSPGRVWLIRREGKSAALAAKAGRLAELHEPLPPLPASLLPAPTAEDVPPPPFLA